MNKRRLFGDRMVFYRPHPSPDADARAVTAAAEAKSLNRWIADTIGAPLG